MKEKWAYQCEVSKQEPSVSVDIFGLQWWKVWEYSHRQWSAWPLLVVSVQEKAQLHREALQPACLFSTALIWCDNGFDCILHPDFTARVLKTRWIRLHVFVIFLPLRNLLGSFATFHIRTVTSNASFHPLTGGATFLSAPDAKMGFSYMIATVKERDKR